MIYTPVFKDPDFKENLIVQKAHRAVLLIERRQLKIEVDDETQMPYVIFEGEMFEVCKEVRGGEQYLALAHCGALCQ